MTLQITNLSGTTSTVKSDFVAVTGTPTTVCTPPAGQNVCNCGFVVSNVTLEKVIEHLKKQRWL